ncbi:MAG: glycosyltransferase, partial [Planctomycetes bacterium]|nr:glycosyltransferase [Planctomycetota bacterium]
AIERFSVRPFDALVDADDRAEAEKTHVVLGGGLAGLVGAVFAVSLTRPLATLRTLARLVPHGFGSDRGLLRHFIYFAEACVLARRFPRLGVDHVHAHFGTNSTDVALYASWLTGVPFSFTVHGPEEFDRPIALRLGRKIHESRFTAGVSSFGRSQLYRWVDFHDWPKIHVVHCGLDRSFLDEPLRPVPASPRLVCVGRLCEQKGQILLVQAAARLAERGVNFELVLVGDGELRRPIEAMIAERGLGDRITITGWQSGAEVLQHLRDSRAFVLPSFAEGLPVAIMEALAIGRPVISTTIAGIPELVTPDCGWCVPAGSIDALTDAMAEALTLSTEELTAMGRCGADRARTRHDVATEAAKLAALFDAGGGSADGFR